MTTNSPNPVDGDVQSYQMPGLTEQQRQKQISFCEAVIKSSWADPLMVESCLISLAALTAEPADRVVDDGCSQRIGCVQVSDKLNCTWPLGTKFYITPPAQLLRPVDLSQCKKLWYEHDDLSAEIVCIPIKEIKKALRQQGFEVKS